MVSDLCLIEFPLVSFKGIELAPADTKLTSINEIEVEFVNMTADVKEILRKNSISVDVLVEKLCGISSVKTKKVPLFDEDVFVRIKSIDEL